MVSMETPVPNVGKFTLQVKPSTDTSPQSQPQQRIEALAAWLLSQWYKQQTERN